MNSTTSLEVWMRGPVQGVPTLLQPVAHALLQVQEDATKYTQNLTDEDSWKKPFGVASIAFHLQHINGVIDRMFTYADDRGLSEEQFAFLKKEGQEDRNLSLPILLSDLEQQVATAITYLKNMDSATLTEIRYLGRKRIPTTCIGLLFHAAEHTQRHIGQLLVTARYLEDQVQAR